jgi:hypothetical protein
MRQVSVPVLVRAGIARRSGRGIALFFDEGAYYLTGEELAHLRSGRNAAIINGQGEWEGNAWLSPVLSTQKRELTVLIHNRLFSVGMRHVNSLLQKERNSVVIREYRGHGGSVFPDCDTAHFDCEDS